MSKYLLSKIWFAISVLPQSQLENNRDYNFDEILDRKSNHFKMILIVITQNIIYKKFLFWIMLCPLSLQKWKCFLPFPASLVSFWISHTFSERKLWYRQISHMSLMNFFKIHFLYLNIHILNFKIVYPLLSVRNSILSRKRSRKKRVI